jgi:hypothetical protein
MGFGIKGATGADGNAVAGLVEGIGAGVAFFPDQYKTPHATATPISSVNVICRSS